MTVTAQSADGVLHQFPDGTPDAVIDKSMQDYVRTAPQSAPDNGGILKNLGAGAESAITSIPGTVVNALNPVPDIKRLYADFTNPAGYTSAQRGADANAAGDSVTHGINSALGTLNPENVTAKTFPERLARGVGAGVTGALIPGAEGYTVGGMLANAALGATSGAGATTGAEIANQTGHPGLAPLAALAGGVAAPMGAVGAVNAVRSGVNAVKGAATGFTAAGPEQTVGKVLAEAAGGTVPTVEAAPLPGMKPTAGQATGNSGLLYLERSAEQGSPLGKSLADESRSASNKAISDAIDQIGNAGGTPSETMLNRLENAQKEAKAATQATWKAAGIDEDANVPKNWLQGRVDNYVNGLKVAERSAIPPSVTDTLAAIPDQKTTLGEIQAWRSQLGDELRSAYRSGLNNKARILGGLDNVVGDFLDELPEISSQGPMSGDITMYKAARRETAQMKQTFNAPGSPVTTALSPKEFGQAASSNTADLFIKPSSSAGAPEALNSYLKAISKDGGLGNMSLDPAGAQAARDAFAQKFRDVISGVPDAQGNVSIKPAAVSKFIDQYDHVIKSDLFTDDQRDLLDRINSAAQMSARTARAGAPGGSDTFAKLSGKNWVDALVGAGAKKISRVAGASAGYATGGPIGGAMGAFGAPKLMETMLAANKEAATKLLTQALYDPKLATALMTPATKASAASISIPLQARIYSILLGKTANDNSARKASP